MSKNLKKRSFKSSKVNKKFEKEVLHYLPNLLFIPNITLFQIEQLLTSIIEKL
jgi:hypothetical protein